MAASEIVLSVVVPITRMAGKLERLQKWLCEVDFKTTEVLLVHDKQDEETGLELSSMADNFSNKNLKLITGSWGNPGDARNQGLTESTGKWIAFWDCDDFPQIQNVMNAIAFYSEYQILIGAFEVIDSLSGKRIKSFHSTQLEDIFFNPGIWRMIFKSEVIRNLEFPPLSMAEDQIFFMKIEPWNRDIKISGKVFYQYFINQTSQLTSQKESIQDLRFAIQQTFICYRHQTSREKKYLSILLIRQCITFLKKIPVSGTIYALPILIYLLVSDSKNTSRVLRNIASSGLEAK